MTPITEEIKKKIEAEAIKRLPTEENGISFPFREPQRKYFIEAAEFGASLASPGWVSQFADKYKNYLSDLEEVTRKNNLGAAMNSDKIKLVKSVLNEIIEDLQAHLPAAAPVQGGNENM